MSKFKNRNKYLGVGLISLFSLTVGGLVLSNVGLNSNLYTLGQTDPSNYSVTLDSSNKVTSNGDHVQHTARGSDVTFTYSGVANSTSGHVTLNSGGTITNKDQITSIDKFTVVFEDSGSLSARIAFVTTNESKWGEWFSLVSNRTVELGSHPYYLQIKAENSAVTINSVYYGFTCTANPNAQSQTMSGDYSVEFGSASDVTNEINANNLGNYITSGGSFISSFASASKVFMDDENHIKFGNNSNPGSFTANVSFGYQITSIKVKAKQYNSSEKTLVFSVNNGGSGYSKSVDNLTSQFADYTLTLPSATTVTSFTVGTSTKRGYVQSITFLYDITTEPGVPEGVPPYETGFTASDSKKDTYTTNSVFDEDNGLVVVTNLSNGLTTSLNKGGDNGYSYVVKDSLNNTIDTSKKFPNEGVYTLIVSYKDYIPQEITLNVGQYIYIEGVTPSMTSATFTTADKMGEHLVGNLTALIELSNNSTRTVDYEDFGDNNLGLKLLTPKGYSHNISDYFGSEGKWSLRVYRLDDENIRGDFPITVNAIPVETISLDVTSKTLYPEDTLQLNTTINPTNATNDAVYWESNNEAVAIVSDSGLVTAVAVGGATITCSATDGSGVIAQCNITVVPKPNFTLDEITRETTGISGESYFSWSEKTCSSDAVYAGNSAGGNNAIQLRSNNSNSGIVSTTSGGKLYSVSVEWNSNTSSGRTLNVYGKNSAYSDANNLFNNTNQGTLLGTIVCGTSTELNIDLNNSINIRGTA